MQIVDFREFMESRSETANKLLCCIRQNKGLYDEALKQDPHKGKDGKYYITYQGKEVSWEKLANACSFVLKEYTEMFVRGYGIPLIAKQGDSYYMGSFDSDFIDDTHVVTDYYPNRGKTEPRRVDMACRSQYILVCENGLICHDDTMNLTRYFSLRDLDDFERRGYFHTDITANARRVLNLHYPEDIAEHIDGFRDNVMADNLRVGTTSQNSLNRYCRGFTSYLGSTKNCKRKHYTFRVQILYDGKYHIGRKCENEIEAACERYMLEHKVVSDKDAPFLYNIKNNHLNQRYELESYIRGEITALGLQRKTLEYVACNPFLVIRYNLSELCRSMCVNIAPFQMNERGYMVNNYGVSYSDLGALYARGLLTQTEIFNQLNVKDVHDLQCYKDNSEIEEDDENVVEESNSESEDASEE